MVETLAHCWQAAQCAAGSGRYIEAFCGSASLFFRLEPETALLVDVNSRLIDFYSTVQRNPDGIHDVLSSYRKDERTYYELRAIDSLPCSAEEAAARFIYLNRYCFNGLYRTNRQGHFNVPYGGARVGALPSLIALQKAARALAKVQLSKGDFFNALSGNVRPGDFVYLDPPYAQRNRSLALQYGPDVFGVHDLERVFDLLLEIDEIGAYFVFSYADCVEAAAFTNAWPSSKVEVQRSIAASSELRGKAAEVLVTNL